MNRNLCFVFTFSFSCAKQPEVLQQTFSVTPLSVVVPHGDAAAIERGRVMVSQNLLCAECHGEDLAGKVYIDGFPMGTIAGPNLTPDGVVADYTDEDWVRIIRHGVRPDGSPVFMMPSSEYAEIARDDLADTIAYLAQLAPIEREVPESRLGLVGRKLVESGSWEVGATEVDAAYPLLVTPTDRGLYLAQISGCVGCHAGGVGKGFGPGQPRSSNLTPHKDGLAGWSLEDFDAAVRRGVRPDGAALEPMMPSFRYAEMSDDDVAALWAWAQALPPQPTP